MKQLKEKKDFIPLIVVTVAALYFVFDTISNNNAFIYRQITGLVWLTLCAILFAIYLRAGILAFGLFLIAGWFGAITISSDDLKFSFSFNLFDLNVPLFNGHPVLLPGAILHFSISGKHYFGIGTKKYRKNFVKPGTQENIQIK
ncbi:MAG: hypothetical protein K2X48_11530 [Chitinophagaceae bacterium]|nr:hypothetical protein [Chitinophagaceae bacterium]